MRRKEPLKNIVAKRVSDWIISSGAQIGERLISEKDLAKLLGVNHLTVRDGLSILEGRGIVERKPRSGTYLKMSPKKKMALPLEKENDFVTVLIRDTGHIFADQMDILCRKLQAVGMVPLVVPLPLDHNYLPALEHIQKTRDMGAEKLVISGISDFWTEPLASQLGLIKGQLGAWEQIVWMDHSPPPKGIAGSAVGLDIQNAAREVIGHLTTVGCRKITYLTHTMDPKHPFPEYQLTHITAYEKAMAEFGLSEHIAVIHQEDLNEGSLKILKSVLASPDRPDAIFASSDFRLLQVLKAADALGLRVPDDLALVGNHNSPWAVEYSLTSTSSEIEAVTDGIVKALTEAPSTDGEPAIRISPRLIVRKSTSISSMP